MKTKKFIKMISLFLIVTVIGNIFAVEADGKYLTQLFGNNNIICGEVQAESNIELTGNIICIQDAANHSAPEIYLRHSNSATVVMYKDTVVMVGVNNKFAEKTVTFNRSDINRTDAYTRSCSFASFSGSPDGQGIIIAGTDVGNQNLYISAFDANNEIIGPSIYLHLFVVDTPTPMSTTLYSYADEHKIVSTDGVLELNLDAMTYDHDDPYEVSCNPPKIYYASDGILTVEACMATIVRIPAIIHADGYRNYGVGLSPTGDLNKTAGTEYIQYICIEKKGHNCSEEDPYSQTTFLPVRVIRAKGSGYYTNERNEAYYFKGKPIKMVNDVNN